MKSTPILFSTPMVEAILKGRKCQTRRIIKGLPEYQDSISIDDEKVKQFLLSTCPFGQAGDELWVRETFRFIHHYGFDYPLYQYKDGTTNGDIADPDQIIPISSWRPSIHMPREANRIVLLLDKVRIERLQDISSEDAIDEGIELIDGKWKDYFFGFDGFMDTCTISGLLGDNLSAEIVSFASLWASINGLDSWKANPWVYVLDFKEKGGEK